MFSRWVLIVASLMNSLAAASRLVLPPATSSRTSSSRWLSGPGPGSRNRLISRVATDGDSAASPCAADRTARSSSSRGASLSRYPVAPASMAGSTWLSVS